MCIRDRRHRAQLHLDGKAVRRNRLCQPVQRIEVDAPDGQCCPRADHQLVVGGVQADDVERVGLPADLDPAALANGETDQAGVPAKDTAFQIDNIAGAFRFGAKGAHYGAVIAVGHKADVLAVGLLGDAQAEMPVSYTHLDVYKRQG